MTRITNVDLARKVMIMRLAQKESDRSGLLPDRQLARHEESKVDELLAKILDKQKSLDL